MNRAGVVAKIEEIAERVARSEGIEIVEVELKGGGKSQILRIVIDKPAGVTHGDCEFISQQVGTILDVEDVVKGAYNLEVSSPGVERKLRKLSDWERFAGQKVKVVLREPVETAAGPLKYFDGTIAGVVNGNISVDLPQGGQVNFAFDLVDRANLKFEW